ncbi:hypothetical protein JM654_23545 [Microbacterium oxydans]|nr:hypothetical protein [Microbacterium oxydans]
MTTPEEPAGTLPDAMAAVRHVASIEYGRVVASVIGTVHDWALAEDAVQDALARGVERWPGDGVPANPAAWVTTVARRRAIDLVRHADAERRAVARLENEPHEGTDIAPGADDHDDAFPHGDERLKLIFTACHPRADLGGPRGVDAPHRPERVDRTARRDLRGRTRDDGEETRAGAGQDRAREHPVPRSGCRAARQSKRERLRGPVRPVHHRLLRSDAAARSRRRGHPACSAVPAAAPPRIPRLDSSSRVFSPSCSFSTPAARHAPRPTACPCRSTNRIADCGMSPRSREGLRLLDDAVEEAARAGIHGGRHLIRATVAAEYVRPAPGTEIDHARIADMYGVLEQVDASPFVRLNRAVAVANAGRQNEALALTEALESSLGGHHLYSAVRGDLLQRLKRVEEARSAFRDAARAAPTEREQRSYAQHADDIASAST